MDNKEERLKTNRHIIVKMSLALESFEDDMHLSDNLDSRVKTNLQLVEKAYNIVNFYQKNCDNKTINELLNLTEDVIKQLTDIFDNIGKEKFEFYDDGTVGYKYVNLKKDNSR